MGACLLNFLYFSLFYGFQKRTHIFFVVLFNVSRQFVQAEKLNIQGLVPISFKRAARNVPAEKYTGYCVEFISIIYFYIKFRAGKNVKSCFNSPRSSPVSSFTSLLAASSRLSPRSSNPPGAPILHQAFAEEAFHFYHLRQ